MNREKAARRVAAGAAVLDQMKPNWFEFVDNNTLSMIDPHRCVFGQVYGDYYLAKPRLQEHTGHHYVGTRYGLIAWSKVSYLILGELWIEEIEKRRELKLEWLNKRYQRRNVDFYVPYLRPINDRPNLTIVK